MGLSLAPGLHMCVANGHAVGLDLSTQRYFALPPTADTALVKVMTQGELSVAELRALDALLEKQILMAGPGRDTEIAPRPLPKVAQTACPDMAPFAPSRLVAECLAAHLAASLRLHVQSLKRVLHHLRRQKSRNAETPRLRRDEAGALIAAAWRARRLIPTQNKCLRTSLAEVDLFMRHRYNPDFIIGVRMNPFGAHAWLQDETCVINDTVDHVAQYTPLVVI